MTTASNEMEKSIQTERDLEGKDSLKFSLVTLQVIPSFLPWIAGCMMMSFTQKSKSLCFCFVLFWLLDEMRKMVWAY